MSCPPAIMAQLKMQRETLIHGAPHQDYIARWWEVMLINDRRTLLAFADLDDSTENARRPWMQHSQERRDKIIHEGKRLHALLDRIKWA